MSAQGVFMVDHRRLFERRRSTVRHVGPAPHPVVSLVVTLIIITAPWWGSLLFSGNGAL